VPYFDDETVPKKKGGREYKEQNGRTQVQEDKRTTYEGEPSKEHQVPKPPLCHKKHIK